MAMSLLFSGNFGLVPNKVFKKSDSWVIQQIKEKSSAKPDGILTPEQQKALEKKFFSASKYNQFFHIGKTVIPDAVFSRYNLKGASIKRALVCTIDSIGIKLSWLQIKIPKIGL